MDQQHMNSEVFARCLTEAHDINSVPLYETTLARIFEKHASEGYFIVSAYRHEYDEQTNRWRTDELEQEIRSLGKYSYLPVTGGYVEYTTDADVAAGRCERSGERVEVYERSFLVMGKGVRVNERENTEFILEMLDDASYLCRMFDQDSVLVCVPGEPPKYIDAYGCTTMKFDGSETFNNMLKEYFTQLHNGRPSKPSHYGSHGRWSFRTADEQKDDEAAIEPYIDTVNRDDEFALATNGPSDTMSGNHIRHASGDLSEGICRGAL